MVCSAQGARRIDHVDAVETRRAGSVGNRRRLTRLALAIEEGPAETIAALVADCRAGIPEFRRADLVGHVLDHSVDLAVLDPVEQFAAELGVVALLID